MILADTSIWIDHLRHPGEQMKRELDRGGIVMHPFVIAEIALGSLRNRQKTLAAMEQLWQIGVAHLDEVRSMIEVHTLYSNGVGLTDAHLIAACLLTPGTRLWTRDARLSAATKRLGIEAHPVEATAN